MVFVTLGEFTLTFFFFNVRRLKEEAGDFTGVNEWTDKAFVSRGTSLDRSLGDLGFEPRTCMV